MSTQWPSVQQVESDVVPELPTPEYHDLSLGDLLEGIVLHAFEGKCAFSTDSLERIATLAQVYDLDLTSSTHSSLVTLLKLCQPMMNSLNLLSRKLGPGEPPLFDMRATRARMRTVPTQTSAPGLLRLGELPSIALPHRAQFARGELSRMPVERALGLFEP